MITMRQEASAQEYWRIQKESMLADRDRYIFYTELSNRRKIKEQGGQNNG